MAPWTHQVVHSVTVAQLMGSQRGGGGGGKQEPGTLVEGPEV